MRASRSWARAVCAFAGLLAIPSRAEPVSAPASVPAASVPAAGVPAASVPVATVPTLATPAAAIPVNPAAAVASPASQRASLPSYFTVELGASGALFADGSAVGSVAELGPLAQQAVADGSFAGAVLFADVRAAGMGSVAESLRRAGFSTLVEVRRNAPPELSALARSERERARRARQRLIEAGVIEGDTRPSSAGGPSDAPLRSAGARDKVPSVELQTVGLYLAGAANLEPTRRQLVKLFERSFGAFKRCHGEAPEHAENASFGVDLLVPKEGGRAKVRETRTRLAGRGFQVCMQRAFEAIRFDPLPSGRPEIVSYSVLFRPVKRQ